MNAGDSEGDSPLAHARGSTACQILILRPHAQGMSCSGVSLGDFHFTGSSASWAGDRGLGGWDWDLAQFPLALSGSRGTQTTQSCPSTSPQKKRESTT